MCLIAHFGLRKHAYPLKRKEKNYVSDAEHPIYHDYT